ncbi:hypothetical protein EIN_486480 [Entamoeba invadens IP1]|uniref:Uncharacterized protein n=1 Tax=Entamoeba invadens IP1 TaxID=370355 RepID=A0A0A1U4M8_ENTIV|nr:hypothetical protein EIN_486480 [Entamoeba invadens IP1]ELP89206.1 hypothetical protein EIN_486480 [Entamoeba invadens IP1]|eukprot:XP_004255977.1 hypothetical protein EIN_486480 [Entamoeba invadens IP1]
MFKFLFNTIQPQTFSVETIDVSDSSCDVEEILLYTTPSVLCLCNVKKGFVSKNTMYKYQLKTTYSLILSKYPLIPVTSYIPHSTLYGRQISHTLECFIIRVDFPTSYNHLIVFTNVPQITDVVSETDIYTTTLSNCKLYAFREIHDFVTKALRLEAPSSTVILYTGDFSTTVTVCPDKMSVVKTHDIYDLFALYARDAVNEQLANIPLLGITKTYLKECATWVVKFAGWMCGSSDGLGVFLDKVRLYSSKCEWWDGGDVRLESVEMYNVIHRFLSVMNVSLKADALTNLLMEKHLVVSFTDFQELYEPFFTDVLLNNKGGRAMNKDFMMLERVLEATSLNFLMDEPILTDRTLHTFIMNSFTKNGKTQFLAGVECNSFQHIPNAQKMLPSRLKGISVTFTE